MSKKEPIIPSGERGWQFEKKGFQEKNLKSLLSILGKKEALSALQALGENDATTWSSITQTVMDLRDIVDRGGSAIMVHTFTESVKENIKVQLKGAVSDLQNSVDQIIADQLAPMYEEFAKWASGLSTFVNEYQTGAFIGALVGSIFGPLGELLGAATGSLMEYWVTGQWAKDLMASKKTDLDQQQIWDAFGESDRWTAQHMRELTGTYYDPSAGVSGGGGIGDFSNITPEMIEAIIAEILEKHPEFSFG